MYLPLVDYGNAIINQRWDKIYLFISFILQKIIPFININTKFYTNFLINYIETYNDKQNQSCYIYHVIKRILKKYSFEL